MKGIKRTSVRGLSVQAGLALAVLMGASVLRAQSAPLSPDSVQVARQLTTWLFAGTTDSILARFGERGSNAAQKLPGFVTQVRSFVVSEVRLIEEKWVWVKGDRQYWRVIASGGEAPEPLVVRWHFRGDGKLVGYGVSLFSLLPPVDSVGPRP